MAFSSAKLAVKIRRWWRANGKHFRFPIALLVILFSLLWARSSCQLWNAAPLFTLHWAPACSVEDWVAITQLWINVGIVYVAIFDRAWLWDAIRPILKAAERTAGAAGNFELARILRAVRVARKINKEGSAAEPTSETVTTPPAGALAAGVASVASAAPDPAPPKKPKKRRWLIIAALGLLLVAAVGGAVWYFWLRDETPVVDASAGTDQGNAEPPAPEPPAPTSYRVVLPESIDSVWRASFLCTGRGIRWSELRPPLNPNLRINGDLVIISDRDQELIVPADWDCPAAWRVP